MKRVLLSLVVLASLAWAADARFPRGTPVAPPTNPNLMQENVFGLASAGWNDPSTWYVPGTGNPALSTDDWYHSNGVYGMRPYDLTAADCGAAGAAIAAARGRYAWVFGPDHGSATGFTWTSSFDYRIGYTNDPGVLPARAPFAYSIGRNTAAAPVATFTGTISGNTLTASGVSGVIMNDGPAFVTGAGVTQANILSQSTGTGGQDGTYTISGAPQSVGPVAMVANITNAGIYQDPQLLCNPDDATYPFYIYSEMGASGVQHVMAVIKSADLVTWTDPLPTHGTLNFNAWASFQRVKRNGTGDWESVGLQAGFPMNGNTFARTKWTSTDGLTFQPATSSADNLNNCIPASAQVGTSTSCTGTNVLSASSANSNPYTITVGSDTWMMGGLNTINNGTREGSQWVGRFPVDADLNVIDSPAPVTVSAAYDGIYPGPNYLQNVSGYVEDGIAHYYALAGWPISATLWATRTYATFSNGGACASAGVAGGARGVSSFVGSIGGTGTVLTVTSLTSGTIVTGAAVFGGNLGNGNGTVITGQSSGTPGGAGDYTVTMSSPQNISSGSLNATACGGLWQQKIDYYTEVIDATAAASAAPVGVQASCANDIATLTWYNSLPHQNYRVYRGTTVGSQPTNVGDVTGTSTTDAPGGTGVYYYKVVTLNGGEQGSRIVSTYCSSSSAFVNAHINRALAEGADASTCNRTIMDSFESWLISEGLLANLRLATSVYFCVAQDGSNVISKIFDMGTTRLPRGGDYTPTTSNTTYSATGINSNPAWVNTSSAYGYYGGDRSYSNNIRRQTQITFFAAYQKPGTGQVTPFISGQFGGRIELTHTSGAPGSASFYLFDGTTNKTATSAFSGSATDFHTMAGVFDGTDLIAYADGAAGTPQSGLTIPSPTLNPADALTGQQGLSGNMQLLGSGGDQFLRAYSTGAITATGSRAGYSGALQAMFDIGLTAGQNASLNSLVRGWQGL